MVSIKEAAELLNELSTLNEGKVEDLEEVGPHHFKVTVEGQKAHIEATQKTGTPKAAIGLAAYRATRHPGTQSVQSASGAAYDPRKFSSHKFTVTARDGVDPKAHADELVAHGIREINRDTKRRVQSKADAPKRAKANAAYAKKRAAEKTAANTERHGLSAADQKRVTSRKHGGDDAYSHAVFIDGKQFVGGLHHSEVPYYKQRAMEHLAAKKKKALGEEVELDEKYVGFDNLVKGGMSPKLAAWIGRRKYGKDMDKSKEEHKEEDKKMNENTLIEGVSQSSKDYYEFANGKKPKGVGSWLFSTVHPKVHDMDKDPVFSHHGSFSEAQKAAIWHFKNKGHQGEVHVLT